MTGKDASRALRKQIGHPLLNRWDPIGVRDKPEAQNEYEGYVFGVFRLLLDGADDVAIAAYLLDVERDRMGMEGEEGTSDARRLAVARAVRALPLPPHGSHPSS